MLTDIFNSNTSSDGDPFTHDTDGNTGTVIETSDYYPFGKRIQVTGPVTSTGSVTVQSVATSNRWRFSGKKGQSFLGAGISLLDFGARMCNPSIARWTASDLMVWLFRVSQH